MARDFYDQLAPYYHLLFESWQASIDRQGAWLDGLIRTEWPAAHSVLDAAAGIGTQSLGLAARGYEVTASDVSPVAIVRAGREAEQRGLTLRTAVADMRSLPLSPASFDLVIACDNAIPHLLSDEDILYALKEFFRCLRPGGGCLLSVRDYSSPGTGSEFHPYGVRSDAGGRYILFQVWEWDRSWYDFSFYVIHETSDRPAEVSVFHSRYYAVPCQRLLELMAGAGFEKVRQVEGFYQPVLVGTRPSAE
jgi:SAM-dependent methyltransferase